MSVAELRALELECEATILQAAQIAGWRRHGERAAVSRKKWSTPIKGEPGWPDLVLVKQQTIVVAELKRHPNTPTDDQLAWLFAFDLIPRCRAMVLWVPEEMDDFNVQLFARQFEWRQLEDTLTAPR